MSLPQIAFLRGLHSNVSFFQLPDKYQPSGIWTAQWIDETGTVIRTNGDLVPSRFVNWQSGATPPKQWLELWDDDLATETVSDQITIVDQDSSSSFIVSFCD